MNIVDDYALLPFVAPETIMILAHMDGSFHFEDILQVVVSENIYGRYFIQHPS